MKYKLYIQDLEYNIELIKTKIKKYAEVEKIKKDFIIIKIEENKILFILDILRNADINVKSYNKINNSTPLIFVSCVCICTLCFLLLISNFVFLNENVETVSTQNNVNNDNVFVLDSNYQLDDKEIPVYQEVTIYFDKTEQNGCNEKFTITLPDGQVFDVDLNSDESITFIATKPGVASIECWMGMQYGTFEVSN